MTESENDYLGMPWIKGGTGNTPKDGGCIMQLADWVSTYEWTDQPECVHPVIRALAIEVNDKLGDEERQQLVPLLPRMLNTNTGDEALTRKLLAYLARRSYRLYETWAKKAEYDDGGAVLACIEAAEQGEAARTAEAEEAAAAAWAARTVEAAEAAAAAWAAEAAAAAWAGRTAEAAAAAAAAWAAAVAFDYLGLLLGLLDQYDSLTERTNEPEPIDLSPVCEAMATA